MCDLAKDRVQEYIASTLTAQHRIVHVTLTPITYNPHIVIKLAGDKIEIQWSKDLLLYESFELNNISSKIKDNNHRAIK